MGSLEHQKIDLEKTINEDTAGLNNLSLPKIGSAIWSNPEIQQQVSEVKKEYSFLQLDEYGQIKDNIDTLRTSGDKIFKGIELITTFRTGKRPVAIGVFVLLSAGLYLLTQHISWVQKQFEGVRILISLIAAYLSQLLVLLGPAIKIVNTIYAKLISVNNSIKRKEEQERTKFDARRELLKEQDRTGHTSQNTTRTATSAFGNGKNRTRAAYQ